MRDRSAAAAAGFGEPVDSRRYGPVPVELLTDNGSVYTANGTTLQTGSFSNLSPTYIAQAPLKDGWQHFYTYNQSSDSQAYNIRSLGRDGTVDGGTTCGTTTNFNNDIVYSNGTFLQWPEGTQN
jgi:hypothetical protein